MQTGTIAHFTPGRRGFGGRSSLAMAALVAAAASAVVPKDEPKDLTVGTMGFDTVPKTGHPSCDSLLTDKDLCGEASIHPPVKKRKYKPAARIPRRLRKMNENEFARAGYSREEARLEAES